MRNICEDCGKCCLETEMILSRRDINIIEKNIKDIKYKDFTQENEYGQLELKNVDDHCVFFEKSSKLCTIYQYRPEGCKFYPLIFDFQKKTCILDKDCPRTNLFYREKENLLNSCKNLKKFLKNQLNLIIN
jgi:Fe-S-cluster containining protein